MPTLAIISQNPAGDSLLTGLGFVIVGLVAAAIALLWLIVARRTVRREETVPDGDLEALRHLSVVAPAPSKSGEQKAVVAELKPDSEVRGDGADLARPAQAQGR